MFVNQKSILLATAIVLSSSLTTQAQSDIQEVTINFAGSVGDREFACGESYEGVGAAESTITPTDFRFYVSNLAMVDESGNEVPIELEQDGKWQHENVALLDFEDGSGACDNGTPETRTTVVGTVPAGDYQDLQFTLGVPKRLNHEDAALAPSPLNLTSMWWNWQGGYKFLRVEMETDKAIANVNTNNGIVGEPSQLESDDRAPNSQPDIFQNGQKQAHGSHEMEGMNHGNGGHDMKKHNASSNGYLIHLGSTGCQDSAKSNLFSCANPNRTQVTLENFNPSDNVVVADLAELLYTSDLSQNQADTPMGCMSSPEDSDCLPIMENLGIPISGTSQNFFFVE